MLKNCHENLKVLRKKKKKFSSKEEFFSSFAQNIFYALSIFHFCINAALPSRRISFSSERISISEEKLRRKGSLTAEKAFWWSWRKANGLNYGQNKNANATIRSTHLPQENTAKNSFAPKIFRNYPFAPATPNDLWKSSTRRFSVLCVPPQPRPQETWAFNFSVFFGFDWNSSSKKSAQHQHELHAWFSQMHNPLITPVPSAELSFFDKWKNYLG